MCIQLRIEFNLFLKIKDFDGFHSLFYASGNQVFSQKRMNSHGIYETPLELHNASHIYKSFKNLQNLNRI